MKIGIISDTHIDKHPGKITEIVDKYLDGVDLILHAGDYKNAKVISILKQRGNFVGVWGNVDSSSSRELLNEKEIIDIQNYKIGIYHGHGEEKTTADRAYDAFRDDRVDIIVFGHSHLPFIATKNRVLMLNPGSPTYKRKEKWFSYIILELDKDSVNVNLKLFTGR